MRKLISLLLAAAIIVTMCACQGDFGAVNLQEAIEIPEDGIIEQSIIEQIKKENAIGSFYGQSNGFKYEWTLFGSDIETAKETNLSILVESIEPEQIRVSLLQNEPFGFSALLSVYTDKLWDAQSATAYHNNRAIASVSLTGTKQTILNLSVDASCTEFEICPDEAVEEIPLVETQPDAEEKSTDSDKATSSQEETEKSHAIVQDDYLSDVKVGDNRVYSDGKGTEKDKYLTDPVPEGKPLPVEPEDQEIDTEKFYSCTFSIECSTILNNLSDLEPDKLEMVPADGIILPQTTVTFYEGESVYDVLQRVCRENGIHMESSWTPIYNSAYVEGIHNLYEFDCGSLSGWMYRVNGWYPNYGCSRYQLKAGEKVEWRYTCDLGNDIGGAYAVGGQSE